MNLYCISIDDSDEEEYEEGYKYSHSSSYKHGDQDEHDESDSYSDGDSESEESEDEDSDHEETRDSSIIYGKHPSGKMVVKQPTKYFKSPKHHKSPSTSTHHQYMVFDDGADTSTPPKHYPKKATKHVTTPQQPAHKTYHAWPKAKPHTVRPAHDDNSGSSLHVDKQHGYSSYVVHQMPHDSAGQAVSSSLVSVGADIQVAGNGNYNAAAESVAKLHGYPDLMARTAGGYMNTKYTSDYDDRKEKQQRREPKYAYEDDIDYK